MKFGTKLCWGRSETSRLVVVYPFQNTQKKNQQEQVFLLCREEGKFWTEKWMFLVLASFPCCKTLLVQIHISQQKSSRIWPTMEVVMSPQYHPNPLNTLEKRGFLGGFSRDFGKSSWLHDCSFPLLALAASRGPFILAAWTCDALISRPLLLCDEMHLWCKVCQGSTLRATPGQAPLHNPLHHLMQCPNPLFNHHQYPNYLRSIASPLETRALASWVHLTTETP